MDIRVTIQWTETAKEKLKALPRKVRKGLVDKIDALSDPGVDPRNAHKPLVGPLQGLYRITYGRYRAVYSTETDHLASGDLLIRVIVRIVAVGIRKDGDKHDVYDLAKKLVEMGLIDVTETDIDAESENA